MLVIPMKWMPWMLLIGGAYGAFSGENVAAGLTMLAIGGAWLYFRKKLAQP